ncbi:MAG TPA: hypothetical protein VN715_23205 [Roseiarcus sp.]|nr:hypothetical protein [Roseiarcus sp.]
MDQPNTAFGLFEVAITLDKTVRVERLRGRAGPRALAAPARAGVGCT